MLALLRVAFLTLYLAIQFVQKLLSLRCFRNVKSCTWQTHWSALDLSPGHHIPVNRLRDMWRYVFRLANIFLFIGLPGRGESLLFNIHLCSQLRDGIFEFTIGVDYFFTLFVVSRLQRPVILLPIEEQRIFGVLLDKTGVDSIDLGRFFQHIVIRQGFEFFRWANHKHFVLLVDPPMFFFPFLVVGMHHFRK